MERWTCRTRGCEVNGYLSDEPGHCSICLATMARVEIGAPQLTVYGDERDATGNLPVAAAVVTATQPRLFEPQLEGQLDLLG